MLLDKALIIKGAAGVAAVGGVAATGGIVFKDQIRDAFSNSSGANEGNGGGTQQNAVTQGSQITEDSRNNGKGSKVTIDQPSKLGPGAIGDQEPRADEGVTGSQSAKEIQSRSGNPQGGGGSAAPSGPAPSVKTDEEKKGEKKEAVNAELKKLGLSNCLLEDKDITEPTTFSKECVLDETKFKAINFSNKGTGTVTVSGWSSNITLKIENKNDNKVKYTFKGVTSKLTISGDQTKPSITLKANEEREFEEKNSKLGKVPKSSDEASKITALNKKLESIKIPNKCWFEEEENDTSIECDLSNQEDLKKIDFSNRNEENQLNITGSTDGLKLTINRLSDQEGALKYSPSSDLEFIFSGYSNEIKIVDSSNTNSDIVLKTNVSSTFTINNDSGSSKLAKSFNNYALGFKVGLSCSGSAPNIICRPKESAIKVLNSSGTEIEEISVKSSDTNTQIICVTEDVAGYEEGIKFTVTQAFPSSPSSGPKLEKADYQAKYITSKGWGLVKKTN